MKHNINTICTRGKFSQGLSLLLSPVLPCPFFFRSIAPRHDRTSTEWGTTEVRIGSVPDSQQACKYISQEAAWRYGGQATLKRRGKSFFNFLPRKGVP